jgi:hypothetical protein
MGIENLLGLSRGLRVRVCVLVRVVRILVVMFAACGLEGGVGAR